MGKDGMITKETSIIEDDEKLEYECKVCFKRKWKEIQEVLRRKSAIARVTEIWKNKMY